MDARYELKFVLPVSCKEKLLNEVSANLMPDPHGEDAQYRISSIYFDTPDHRYYREKVDGIEIRKKVRLRFYHPARDSDYEHPKAYFLEIKRRYNNSIAKERLALPKATALELIDNEKTFHELKKRCHPESEKEKSTLENLEVIYENEHIQATNIITYLREAWIGKWDEKLRVTFDFFVQAYRPCNLEHIRKNDGCPLVPHTFMVMELKFDRAVPIWLRDAVVKLGYSQRRFSKYAHGVEQIHENRSLSSRLFL